jgi:hypothetical protein
MAVSRAQTHTHAFTHGSTLNVGMTFIKIKVVEERRGGVHRLAGHIHREKEKEKEKEKERSTGIEATRETIAHLKTTTGCSCVNCSILAAMVLPEYPERSATTVTSPERTISTGPAAVGGAAEGAAEGAMEGAATSSTPGTATDAR